MKLAHIQFSPIAGALSRNREHMENAVRDLCEKEKNIDAIFFPEMALTGYDLGDLYTIPLFVEDVHKTLQNMAIALKNFPPIILGAPHKKKRMSFSLYAQNEWSFYNSVFMLKEGELRHICDKIQLPTSDVFDEKRLFDEGTLTGPIILGGHRVGICVCEDMWHEDPLETLSETGAEMIVVLNGSPFHDKHFEQRLQVASYQARQHACPIIYLNLSGGHDELVFDGRSFAVDHEGHLTHMAKAFTEDVMITNYVQKEQHLSATEHHIEKPMPDDVALYHALVIGLRNYVVQSGFSQVCLGLSGGADSTLSAVIAADALGAENVLGVLLPSKFTSKESVDDAHILAKNFGIPTTNIPIHDFHTLLIDTMREHHHDDATKDHLGVSGENAQARIRALLLMTLANSQNRLLLTTGNKSELALGYSTLYGDSCGAYNPVKDIFKSDLYRVMQLRNTIKGQYGFIDASIHDSIFTKDPSAELRFNQKDTDSLPPYEQCDHILRDFMENHAQNYAFDDISENLWKKLCQSEFKRKQSAPGTRISQKAFGIGWRFPTVNHYVLPKSEEY